MCSTSHALVRAVVRESPCTRALKATASSMFMRGFNDEYGSWKTIWTWRQNALNTAAEVGRVSCPSKRISPASGSSRRCTRRASVDLPQPIRPQCRESPHAAPQRTPHPRLSPGPGPFAACRHVPESICAGALTVKMRRRTGPYAALIYSRTSMASRRPSLSRLNAIEVKKIITPGSTGTQVFT